MKNLHQINEFDFNEEVRLTIWYYRDYLRNEVGISGKTLVFKDPYYGPLGRWNPIVGNTPDDIQYMKENWQVMGSPQINLEPIKRQIKMD